MMMKSTSIIMLVLGFLVFYEGLNLYSAYLTFTTSTLPDSVNLSVLVLNIATALGQLFLFTGIGLGLMGILRLVLKSRNNSTV